MNLPNLISLGRLLSVPLIVWLILIDWLGMAFWVFVLSGLSDAVDGFLAKRLHAETELGRILDPLADKALLVGVYITLGQAGYLAEWVVILVVFRDALIVGGAIVSQVLSRPLRMRPLIVSKINTAAQILLAAGALAAVGLELGMARPIGIMTYAVGVTTIASGTAYLVTWARQFAVNGSDEA